MTDAEWMLFQKARETVRVMGDNYRDLLNYGCKRRSSLLDRFVEFFFGLNAHERKTSLRGSR